MRINILRKIEGIDMNSKENSVRKLLNNFSKDLEGNHNRKTLGLRSYEEYVVEKEALVEDTIHKLNSLDIIIEIRKLQERLL